MTQPTIWRRDRAAVKERIAAKKAADEAYRQQFVDAATAEASASSSTFAAKPAQPQQQQQAKQQQGGKR